VCAQVGNQRSRGVVTSWVRADAVRSLRHQRQDLHQSTYPVPLGRSGLILLSVREVGVTLSSRFRSHSCLRCEPTQERGDGHQPSHSLPCHWLEFCDEISRKSTTGGGDLTD
jgi:hypothetical protein